MGIERKQNAITEKSKQGYEQLCWCVIGKKT